MHNNPKVSIIIPVWNSGEGISRCVASLRGQTLKDIEMIFVDDCGTDGAMAVVRAAAAEDPRIRIITNEKNMGAGASRNAGIEAAHGEYLAFVDADDYVNWEFLERLNTKAVADDLDIAKGRRIIERADGTVAIVSELNEAIRRGLESGKPLYVLFAYEHPSAIYRRDFLIKNNIRYGISRRGEDTTFLLKACHKAVRFGFGENAEYHYVEWTDSLVHDMHPHTFERRLHALRERMDYIVESMASEELVSHYVTSRVNYDIRLSAHYRKNPECLNEAEGFIKGVRAEVLRFPQLAKSKRESFPVRVLCDYGIGLAFRPFKLPWEELQAAHYVETIREWVDFVVAYPNMLAGAEIDLYRLFREADSLVEKQKGKGNMAEAKRVQRALSVQAERLPRHCCDKIFVQNPALSHTFVYNVKVGLKKTYKHLRKANFKYE